MSNVFPFIARMTMKGDWSSGERARLLRMAEHLSGGPDEVDVAFGRTDEGDPWCVVLDPMGEVLVHVARVGGRFIIHHMVDGAFEEGSDFLATLHKFMGPGWVDEEPEDVVVQLNVQGRKGQTLTALIIATTFFYATAGATDFHDIGGSSDTGGDGAAEPTTLAAVLDLFIAHDKAKVAVAAAIAAASDTNAEAPLLQTAAQHHDAPPVPDALQVAAAAAEAPPPAGPDLAPPPAPAGGPVRHSLEVAWMLAGYEKVVGTDGHDVLVGGPGPSLILAGLGDDYLHGGGAGPGEVDLLDGGAGNDTIVMAANTIAVGGPGADTFIVSKPAAPDADKAAAASNASSEPGMASAGFAPAGEAAMAARPSDANEAKSAAGAKVEGGEVSFGVVLDYNQAEGDQIKSANGNLVVVVSSAPTSDVLADLRGAAILQGLAAVPGDKLSLDIDGDGVADGVLFVGRVGQSLIVTLASLTEMLTAEDDADTDAADAPSFIGLTPLADLELF